jgi:hypothetical protein
VLLLFLLFLLLLFLLKFVDGRFCKLDLKWILICKARFEMEI